MNKHNPNSINNKDKEEEEIEGKKTDNDNNNSYHTNENKSNTEDNDINSNIKTNTSNNNIFYIMDGIIDQLNKTKKLFIIMILTIMIIPPIAFMLTFSIFGPTIHNWDRDWMDENGRGQWGDTTGFSSFRFVPLIPIIIVLVWLGIGIRQWFVLTKWDKRYKKYKELQKKIDEELGKEDQDRTN